MYIGVYIYGAEVQVLNHGNDKESAIDKMINNLKDNFALEEDAGLLFEVQVDQVDKNAPCVFSYTEYLLEPDSEGVE